MKPCIVFYSWQVDLPNKTNRGFIQKALENAVKAIRADASILVEPVLDRDTLDVPGAPDIANTIFTKIEQAHIFVCDVSIIHPGLKKPTPNPNVLIELGYAKKALGADRIIMVMNKAFGGPELLPFDLRPRRALVYSMPEDLEERAAERRKLEAGLEEGLRTIISLLDREPSAKESERAHLEIQTRQALENAQPNQTLLTNKLVQSLWRELESIAPPFPGIEEGAPDERLLEAIAQTQSVALQFARLTSTVAAVSAAESASAIYKSFGQLLTHHDPPQNFSGTFYRTHADFYKFIGHELFVIFVSFLVREGRWKLLADLLEEELFTDNHFARNNGLKPFGYLSERVELLIQRNSILKLNRASLQADLLHARHSEGELAELVPLRQFIEADYFLHLREGSHWRAWSTVYMGNIIPKYLVEAIRTKVAIQLLRPLNIATIDTLPSHLSEKNTSLKRLFPGSSGFYPLEDFDFRTIASK